MRTSPLALLQAPEVIVLSAGHGAGDPGNVEGSHREADQVRLMTDFIAALLRQRGVRVDVAPHESGLAAAIQYANRYRFGQAWAIEIHRDSADGIDRTRASTCCGIYTNTYPESIEVGVFVERAFERLGMHPTSWSRTHTASPRRSLAWFSQTTPAAHLLELGFMEGDNSDAHLQRLARVGAAVLYEAFTGNHFNGATSPQGHGWPPPTAALAADALSVPAGGSSNELLTALANRYRETDLAELFQRLGEETGKRPMVQSEHHAQLKEITLAQWILESGWASSDLARLHLNFAGLKYRPELANHAQSVRYHAHDGPDDYCKFASIDQFIAGYWRFLMRDRYLAAPNDGWHLHTATPRDFIQFLLARGYTVSATYASKVVDDLLPRARPLLAAPAAISAWRGLPGTVQPTLSGWPASGGWPSQSAGEQMPAGAGWPGAPSSTPTPEPPSSGGSAAPSWSTVFQVLQGLGINLPGFSGSSQPGTPSLPGFPGLPLPSGWSVPATGPIPGGGQATQPTAPAESWPAPPASTQPAAPGWPVAPPADQQPPVDPWQAASAWPLPAGETAPPAVPPASPHPVLSSWTTPSAPTQPAPTPPSPGGQLLQVTASQLNVRRGPGTEHQIVGTLRSGELVEGLTLLPSGWAQIRIRSGAQGWAATRGESGKMYLTPVSGAAPGGAPAPSPGGEAPWMPIARGELGQKEVAGPGDNSRIAEYLASTTIGEPYNRNDETPWCSAFVNWCIERAGLRGTRSALARSWLEWGREIREPVPGCIAVFTREGGGHVAFYLGRSGDNIYVLGGNQSNAVTEAAYAASRLLGYRLPA